MAGSRRVLLTGLAWLFLQTSLAPVRGGDGRDVRSTPTFVTYRDTVSAIIHRRMRNNGYRTRSGGVAVLAFDIARDGRVSTATIRRPSGSPYIDALAKAAVPVGYRFPPLPVELGLDRLSVDVPLRFASFP